MWPLEIVAIRQVYKCSFRINYSLIALQLDIGTLLGCHHN